jgi:hypothetical protein
VLAAKACDMLEVAMPDDPRTLRITFEEQLGATQNQLTQAQA